MIHQCCPVDVVLLIADMLSPTAVSQLASCCTKFREILPVHPLRIKITHSSPEHHFLDHSFFVSEEGGRTLRYDEKLRYGIKYRLWSFDGYRQNQVDLKRHIPLSEKKGQFDIALLARQRSIHDPPNLQLWQVSSADDSSEKDCGDAVPFGSDVILRVAGDRDNHKGHPGSKELSILSCETLRPLDDNVGQSSAYQYVRWHVTPISTGTNEKMKLFRSDDKQHTSITNKTTKTQLPIRARSVFYDNFGAVTFYSQRSLEAGNIDIQRKHAIVRFEIWSENGYLHFHAENLPYSLAIPIVLNDEYEEIANEHRTIEMVYNLKHKNFFPGKMYLAVAADGLEGNTKLGTLKAFGEEEWADGVCDEENKTFIVRYTGDEPLSSVAKRMADIPRDKNRKFSCVFVD